MPLSLAGLRLVQEFKVTPFNHLLCSSVRGVYRIFRSESVAAFKLITGFMRVILVFIWLS